MANAGKKHRKVCCFGTRYDFFVPDASSRLNYRANARINENLQTIGKREEGIASCNSTD
jgi:hypothetical protein